MVTLGSAGDLHPYLAIAREMRRRGHELRFFSQEPHRSAVESEGLAFVAVASARDHDRTLRHPGLWHPVRGFGVLWRHLCVPAIQPTFEALAAWDDEAGAEPLTVLASPLAVGARLLRDARPGLRLLTAYTAPSALRSCDDPMFLGAWKVPRWVPRAIRAALWRSLDAWKLEPMARPALMRCRKLWSLAAPVGSTFGDWIHSPDGGVTLFPRWFAPPASDWPLQPVYAGFPVYETGDGLLPMDAALSAFLDGGSAPVVVIAGSAAAAGGPFLQRAWAACRALDRRCILLSAYPDQWPAERDERLLIRPGAQLSGLLPRAAALVHHGGIGTCAQALAARVPQLILPAAYDQFDNGYRIERAGWGVCLGREARSTRRQADSTRSALAEVLRLGSRRDAATPLAEAPWPEASFESAPNAAVVRVCDWLEG